MVVIKLALRNPNPLAGFNTTNILGFKDIFLTMNGIFNLLNIVARKRAVASLAVIGAATFLCGPHSNLHAQNLSPQATKITDLHGNPTGISTPGQEFLFYVPVKNVTTATQTNVLGVAVPLSNPVTIIDPASNYGNIADGVTTDGSSYRGKLEAGSPVARRYSIKVGFKSDQEQFEREISLPGNTGFENGAHIAAWPPSGYGTATATVAEPAAANASVISLVATKDSSNKPLIFGGSIYTNLRTGELIVVNTVEPETNKIRVRRGQYGNVPAAECLPGDLLAFEGVPIPDAVRAGVALKSTVTPVPGAIGELKLFIEDIVHPRIGDLLLTLECEGLGQAETPLGTTYTVKQTTSVLVLEPLAGGLANGSNISNVTFADGGTSTDSTSGTLTSGTTYEPIEPFSTFADLDGSDVTTWTLRISDVVSPGLGYVKGGWTLDN